MKLNDLVRKSDQQMAVDLASRIAQHRSKASFETDEPATSI